MDDSTDDTPPESSAADLDANGNPRQLDPDRPWLEQFEEAAMDDDRALAWLEREVYARPDRLEVLHPAGLAGLPVPESPPRARNNASFPPKAPESSPPDPGPGERAARPRARQTLI